MSSHRSPSPPIDQFPHLQVLVVGDAMLDCYLQGTADRLCPEAPVPVVAIQQQQEAPGGAGNTATNLAALGAKTLLLAAVGQDGEGERLQTLLTQQGVDTTYLLSCLQRQTLAKQRILAEGHLLVRFDSGSTQSLASELEQQAIDRLTRLFPLCDAIVVSDYGYGMVTPGLIAALSKLQRQLPRVLVVDAKRLDRYHAVGVTAVKPNYTEAIQLLGVPKQVGADRITQILSHREQLLAITGAKIVTVTLDTDGGIVFQKDCAIPHHFEAEPVASIQAIGAGDTFVATLALALAAGADGVTAATIAQQATTIATRRSGTTTCLLKELQQSLSWQAASARQLYHHSPSL